MAEGVAPADGPPARSPKPWLFGVASMPYGSFNGIIAVALPYLLRHRGIAVDRIATISASIQAPAIWYFLWAPVVDVKFRRRTWVLGLSLASAALGAAAIVQDARIGLFAALLTIASVFNQPISSAIGGLVASLVPDRLRGRTGGWSQTGVLGGGILAGALTVWLVDRAPAGVVAAIAALMIAVPSLVVLTFDERPQPREDRLAHVKRVWRETAAMLRRPEVWLGLTFFVSPIGAGALSNLFSAIATEFHATAAMVVLVVAIAGVLTAIGALIAGFLADRYDRWLMYPVAGVLAAVSVAVILAAPMTPTTYLIGAGAYAFATGFGYSAFSALAYQLVGEGGAASGTQFTLFMAAVNIPVVYMLRVDGLANRHFGVRGMLAADGGANLLFAIVLGGVLVARRARAPRERVGHA